MQCKLCKEIFNLNLSYEFLFSFPEICPQCTKKYQPHLREEKIPIDGGEITYYYLYETNSLNYDQQFYLDRNLKIIYKKLSLVDDEVIIFLDYSEMKTIKTWLRFVLPMRKITFFSLVYHDLTTQMFFE